jgi:hypothetical protein
MIDRPSDRSTMGDPDDERRERRGGSAQRESDEARVKQHKAGCDYREESIRDEIMMMHGTPAQSLRAPARTERHVTLHSQKNSSGFENRNLTVDFKQRTPGHLDGVLIDRSATSHVRPCCTA